MTSTTTTNAITSVSHSNAFSPKREGGAMRARVERSSNGICTALIVVILSEAKNLRSFFPQHENSSQRWFDPAQHDRLEWNHIYTSSCRVRSICSVSINV